MQICPCAAVQPAATNNQAIQDERNYNVRNPRKSISHRSSAWWARAKATRRDAGTLREESREIRQVIEAQRIGDLADAHIGIEQLALGFEQLARVHQPQRRLAGDFEAGAAQTR